MTERGIVIGTHFQVETIDFAAAAGVRGTETYRPFLMSGRARARLDLVGPAIRKGLLYFDRIDWPLTNFEPAMLPGVEILEAQGFLQRPGIGITDAARGNFGVGAIEGAHRWHFAQLAAQTDCVWAYAHVVEPVPPGHLPRPAGTEADLAARRAVSLELYDKLPTPEPDVPFADILDFRSRDYNANALNALRGYMDDLYAEVANAEDVLYARCAALDKVDHALSEVWRAMEDAKLSARLSNLRVDLLLADVAPAAAAGLEVAEWAQQAPAEGAAIGATVGTYKFLRRALQSPIDRAGPLAYYLAGAVGERIISGPRL